MPKKQGFTLIELLTVITIIGLLISFAFAAYSSAQAKSRDSKRKQDMETIKKALELVKYDCTGQYYYPAPLALSSNRIENYYSPALPNSLYYALPKNGYMSSVPLDPKNTGNYQYGYEVYTTGTAANACPGNGGKTNGHTDYILTVQLENTKDTTAADSKTKCANNPNLTSLVGNAAYSAAGWYFVCND